MGLGGENLLVAGLVSTSLGVAFRAFQEGGDADEGAVIGLTWPAGTVEVRGLLALSSKNAARDDGNPLCSGVFALALRD